MEPEIKVQLLVRAGIQYTQAYRVVHEGPPSEIEKHLFGNLFGSLQPR